ncbi:MAG TPA: protease pro-enzyme activation domain-containing protein, partial [Thermoplasmata archaeon]
MFRSRSRGPALLAPCLIAVVLVSGLPFRSTGPTSTASAGGGPLVTDQFTVSTVAATGPLPGDVVLSLTVAMRPSHSDALHSFLGRVGDPRSPDYRHFLTHAQFAAAFAPTAGSVAEVQDYFGARGATGFSLTADRLGLSFQIRASGAETALGVRFVELARSPAAPATPVYTAQGTASLPGTLTSLVAGIGGLSNVAAFVAALAISPAGPSGPVRGGPDSFVLDGTSGASEPWYLGSDYASAYGAAALFPPSTAVANATYPSGEAVATLLMSGYDDITHTDLPPFDPAVIDAYFNDTFPSAWPHPVVKGVAVPIAGDTPPPPGSFGGVNDSSSNSLENSLDLEMAGSMAPGATLVNFYFGGRLLSDPSLSPSVGDSADYFAQSLAAAVAFNYSPARLAAVSGSFGLPDLDDALWDVELQVAQAMGVSVLAASGDQGNAPNFLSGRFQGSGPTWPGTAAFNDSGTMAVGGTSPTLTGAPTSTYDGDLLTVTYDATVTGIQDQTAWYDVLGGFGNVSGTEGGGSSVTVEPAWQFHSAAQPAIVSAEVKQGLGSLGRAEPDVAFPANQTVAYISADSSGVYFEVLEGTSVGAPLFAGLLASWSAVAGHPFGYLDPELYRMASYYAANPGDASNPFLDVTTGGNFLFEAAPGWDPTTGWGGLDGVRFLAADANRTVADYTYLGPTPGLPPPFELSGGSPTYWLLFIVGLSVSISIVLVITLLRPRSPPSPYAPGAGGSLP